MPFTNEGLRLLQEMALRQTYDGGALPTEYFLAYATITTTPLESHMTLSDVTEIASGNGYTSGGESVAASAVGFDVNLKDDGNSRAYTQLADVSITATGGPIPSSGNGARYPVLLGPHVTPSSRKLIHWWDFGTNVTVQNGVDIVFANGELGLKQDD